MLAPAKSLAQMQQVVFNDYVDATLAFGFILLVVSIVLFGARACWQAWQSQQPTARETPFTLLPARLKGHVCPAEKLGKNTRSGRQSDGGRA